jgi:hypothetical protein
MENYCEEKNKCNILPKKIQNLFPKWSKDDMLVIRERREVFESL